VLIAWKNSGTKNVGSKCRKRPRQLCRNCADYIDNGKNVHKRSTNKFKKTVTDNSRGRGKKSLNTSSATDIPFRACFLMATLSPFFSTLSHMLLLMHAYFFCTLSVTWTLNMVLVSSFILQLRTSHQVSTGSSAT
jgi:hypothetical protein